MRHDPARDRVRHPARLRAAQGHRHNRTAVTDPKGFLLQAKDGLLIDEIQRVPSLLSYIQTIVDTRESPGQFVISGSQNLLLMEQISQTLAGRISLFTLLPLSLSELSRDGRQLPVLAELLFRGLYPALYDRPFDPPRYFTNYIATYVERDVRLLKQITNLAAFQAFLHLCAGRVGQVVNYTSLGDDAGVSHNTARAWISLLETNHILFPLRPFHRNFGKQVVKMPKIYFSDSGLLCALLGIRDPQTLATHHLRGGIFENFVTAELRKAFFNKGMVPSLHFWRDRRGHEVDLLIESQSSRIAVEAKSGLTAARSFFDALDYYRSLDKELTVADSYVLYGGEENQDRSYGKLRGRRSLADPSAFGV